MPNLIYKSKKYFKKHGSTILTCIGAAGVVTTAVTAVKATPKALLLLDDAKKKKGDALTTFETVKIAAPLYLPAIGVGASTIACIFGANILNKRQQAAMVSAYAMLDNSYKEYRKKVTEMLGEDGEKAVRDEIVKDHLRDKKIIKNEDKPLFYDTYSNRYFNMSMEDFKTAMYNLNRNLILKEYASLNEWYKFLGLDPTDFGEENGWSLWVGGAWYGYQWVDYYLDKVTTDDGLECNIVNMPFAPTFDYMDC